MGEEKGSMGEKEEFFGPVREEREERKGGRREKREEGKKKVSDWILCELLFW